MDARTMARGLALGRIALGAAITVAPARVARGWVGEDGTRPGAEVIGVALGARDLAVGVGSLVALERRWDVRAWFAVSAACDAADFLATFSRRDALPATGRFGV